MRKDDQTIIPMGGLELSLHEVEVLLDVVISMFHISSNLKTDTPNELKAIREKLTLLKKDLREEENIRASIIYDSNSK
jgi:hypothetical protein